MASPEARAFYEIEAAREHWSVRELERHINTFLYHRLTKNRDPGQVLALARKGQQLSVARYLPSEAELREELEREREEVERLLRLTRPVDADE